jgi:hypothetical protein
LIARALQRRIDQAGEQKLGLHDLQMKSNKPPFV